MSALKVCRSQLNGLSKEIGQRNVSTAALALGNDLVEAIIVVANKTRTILPRHVESISKGLNLYLGEEKKIFNYVSIRKAFATKGYFVSERLPSEFNVLMTAWLKVGGRLPPSQEVNVSFTHYISQLAKSKGISMTQSAKDYLNSHLQQLGSTIALLAHGLKDTEGVKDRHVLAASKLAFSQSRPKKEKPIFSITRCDSILRMYSARISPEASELLAWILQDKADLMISEGLERAKENGKMRITVEFICYPY